MAANPDAVFQRGNGTGQRRPPIAKFGLRARFDQRLTEKNGRSTFVDEEVVTITSPDGGVTLTKRVDEWFAEIDRDAANYGQWAHAYRQMYRDWKAAHDAAKVDGTHISNWPLLSPAQVETLLAAGIATIEAVANLPDEIAATIDGGAYIRSKARYWINAAEDIGAVTTEVASLRADNETLRADAEHKAKQIEELKSEVKRLEEFCTGKEGFDIIAGRVQAVGLRSVQAVQPQAPVSEPAEAPVSLPVQPSPVTLTVAEAEKLSMPALREYCYERNLKPTRAKDETIALLIEAGELRK